MPDISNIELLNKLQPLLTELIAAFNSGDYEQRREAAIALSKFKNARITDFLLENFESDNIQDFMALALGNIENPRAISLLIRALNDSQQEVRFNAAQALGMIKNQEAFNVLMESLNEYIDTSVAGGNPNNPLGRIFFEEEAIISAITALGNIRNHLSISLLKRILAQEKSSRIRASVITALGQMSNERMLPVFQAALRDEDSRVRANAIEAIETLKTSSIVGIIQPYLEDPNNRVRANVAKAIWKYGDFDVSETLTRMLEHSDKLYRASAAYAMGEIKEVCFIPHLARALKDDDADVRRNAANALRKIQSPRAVQLLKPLLDDPNYDVRVQVVQAIARCAPDSVKTFLLPKLATEENQIVRATLISCIGEKGDSSVINEILPYLADSDNRVVSNTIEALQKLTGSSPSPELANKFKDLLSHEDNRIKSNAIRALWSWKEYSVLDNLHTMMRHSEKRYRKSAVYALGEIGAAINGDAALNSSMDLLIAKLLTSETDGTIVETVAIPAASVVQTENLKSESLKEEFKNFAPSPKKQIASKAETLANHESAEILEHKLEVAADALGAREYQQAQALYEEVLAAQPDNLKAILGLANLHYMRRNFIDAASLYERALVQQPNLVKAHYNLGSIAYFQKDFVKARDHLIKALNLYPKLLGAYLILAHIFQISGHINESIQLLSRAVELSPRNPVLFQKLAMLHIQVHNYKAAVDVLTKAVTLSPLDVESNLMLAYSLYAVARLDEAFKAFDKTLKACAQAPNSDDALKALMQSYLFIKSMLSES